MPGNEDVREPIAPSAEGDSFASLLRKAAEISEPSSTCPARLGLLPGDVLSSRFEIVARVNSGGMGTIYRGTDRFTGESVAIKVMASVRVGDANRFAHEAVVLAGLSHPSIVRYVAHGVPPEAASRSQAELGASTQFLAMEWLEGEDLAARLRRSPLTIEQSLVLFHRVCEGVACAHASGVVHRDIKPSNLFLVNRDPTSVKVLDFGIARHMEGTLALTQSGAVLGTVGYMSPEQAMALCAVDTRTDVFALGCVLFECLAGRAAFVGPNAVAVLAKVLREDPPGVSELRPGLDAAVDALVARMLAKSPDERPKDAAAILRALDALGLDSSDDASAAARPPLGLTTAEQKIVSVILGKQPAGQTQPTARTCGEPTEPLDGPMAHIRELTRRFGTEPVALRGGGLLVVLSGRGAATDLASQAAQYALLLARMQPELSLAVATGRADTTGRVPVGAAIDRAAELLDRSLEASRGVAIDELTVGLLEPRFEVRREGGQLLLIGESVGPEPTRLLMGKPTPFVGREKELALLELTLRECIDASVARAVLVTGPPGQGKSRLRRELLARVRARGGTRTLIARGDPVGAGSAFLLLRQLVRQAVPLRDGAQLCEPQPSLRRHVTDVCKGGDAARIADFLGELMGAARSDHPSPELRAALNDPKIMSIWLRRSFVEWLSAECAAGPLLIVLEDLHWGDLPSVTYLSEALRALAGNPLMVLTLARNEVHEFFPELWPGTEKQEVALGRLTPRAAEQLVRAALGEPLGASIVARIIERADGNAFYLEELIRRVAEGDRESLPETVLALVQSRLERLEPEARQIVRAASIFGQVLWCGGVAALLRRSADMVDIDGQLLSLAVHEVLVSSPDSRFAGEREYRFRHALLREAAYAMLTDADRAAGHRLAGEWLEQADEQDALILADHFELGGAPKQAVPWLLRATQLALTSGNLPGALALLDRAVACGAHDTHRGVVGWMRASALFGRGDLTGSVAVGRDAMDWLAPGSLEWLLCAANLFSAGAHLGDSSVTAPVLQAILSVPFEPVPTGSYGWVVCNTCISLRVIGRADLARSVLQRAEALGGAASNDISFEVGLRVARAHLLVWTGEPASALRSLTEAIALADRIEHATYQAMSRLHLVAVYADLGSLERAESSARELVSLCDGDELRFCSDRSAAFVAAAKLNAGLLQDATDLLLPLLDVPDRQLAVVARSRLAHTRIAAGDLQSAERWAHAALEESQRFPVTPTLTLGACGLIALQRYKFDLAISYADRGLEGEWKGSALRDGSILRLVRAEALHGLGRTEDARVAIREARDRVFRVAATLDDHELQACYTTGVVPNARTLKLASEWLDEQVP